MAKRRKTGLTDAKWKDTATPEKSAENALMNREVAHLGPADFPGDPAGNKHSLENARLVGPYAIDRWRMEDRLGRVEDRLAKIEDALAEARGREKERADQRQVSSNRIALVGVVSGAAAALVTALLAHFWK